MDITFKCSTCGQNIVIDQAGAGAIVECPKCQVSMIVPSQEHPRAESSATKQCPYCAETIQAAAIKCKHCGEFLPGNAGGQSIAPATKSFHQTAPIEVETVSGGNITAAYVIALIMPCVGFFAGIYLLAKKQPGHGVACMAISAFASFIFYMLFSGG